MEAPHNVKLVVDVALFHDDSVLMTRYREPEAYDGQEGLFLPNDLLLEREDPEDGARRILRDQLGLEDVSVRLVFAESFTGRDRTWHLALHFAVNCLASPSIVVAAYLDLPQWFSVNALPDRREVAHGGWALNTLDRIIEA